MLSPKSGIVLLALLLNAFFLTGCTGTPDGIEPVEGFEPKRYLGQWYEIARLPHSFEEGLSKVSATYSQRDDGGIDVVNRGYHAGAGEWREAEGKAYFTGPQSVASLKVSFFGPFYSGYHVIALDKDNYQWALVCGYNRDYLWILARSPQMPQALRAQLVERADQMGFDTEQLIFVEH